MSYFLITEKDNYRKRLKIEQIRVRRMSFRQDEMLEGDCAVGLAADPPVRDRPDVILRRQRLEDRNGEDDLLSLTLDNLLLGEQEVLVMVDVVVDRVLNPDVERFGSSTVNSIVPPETITIATSDLINIPNFKQFHLTTLIRNLIFKNLKIDSKLQKLK